MLKELKEKLTNEQIIKILESLGASYFTENQKEIIFSTICHNGNSPKLYYYKDTKKFHCYTDCACNYDIYSLICKVKEYAENEVYKAKDYIEVLLGLQTNVFGFSDKKTIIDDWKIIKDLKKRHHKHTKLDLKNYDGKILKCFPEIYYEEWVQEHIKINAMKKFNIKYNILDSQIIIPHYNISGALIGIKVRNLNERNIEKYGKYQPLTYNNTTYSYPISHNLYGLYQNIEYIKNKRKIMIVESEKAVLQCESYFPNKNFTLSVSGSNLTQEQAEIIKNIKPKEIIIALDKEYDTFNKEQVNKWTKYITEKFIEPLKNYMSVYVIFDNSNLLELKQSPTDKGKDILLKLLNNKLKVG